MKLAFGKEITENIVTYKGQFAHVDIRVECEIATINNKTHIYANGTHISSVDTFEIEESEMSFSDYIEDILIRANVGR